MKNRKRDYMELKKKEKKFVKILCYFLLYVIVGIWIILSLFFSKSLDINFTFIITLKITDWIILSTIGLLVPLMVIQLCEEKKLRKLNFTKFELNIKEYILIVGLIFVYIIEKILPHFPQLQVIFNIVLFCMTIYIFVILPILWVIKNGYDKAVVLFLTVVSLIVVKFLDSDFNQKSNLEILNLFNVIITILEQFYLYFLVEFFLKKKKTIQSINQLMIFLIVTIDIRIILSAMIWKEDPKVLSKEIIIKLITAIIFYFIKECLWNPKNNLKKILETQNNLIITEKSNTWKKLKGSFKKLNKKDKKIYKNMKLNFLKYESCLLESNGGNFDESEILLSICEYNKLFKNENLRIFVFDVDNLEVKERFKDKFGSSNYCELGNNVYVIRYSAVQDKNNDKEFFDILNKIFEEKNNQTQNTKLTEGSE